LCARPRIVALLAAVLLAIPGAAYAQSNTVVPSVTLDLRYDSNARLAESGTSDRSDFVASVIPRFEFARDRARYDIRGYYSLVADYHTNNSELNNIAHSAGIAFDTSLTSRWKFGAGDNFNYTQDSLRALGFEQGVLLTRTNMLTNNAFVNIGRQTTRNTEVLLTLRDYVQRFDDPAFVDSRSDSATLTGKYAYSRSGTARFSYSYTNYDFESDGSNVVQTHGVSAGIAEAVSATLNLDLGGGVSYAKGLDGSDELFVTANAGIKKTLKDSVMSLAYERDLTNPTGLTDRLITSDAVTFIWDFTLARNVFASLYTGVAKRQSEPEGAVDLNSYIAEVSGNWQPYKWLILGTGISQYQQWPGDDLGTGLTRSKIFVNLTLTGGEWRF